MNATAPGVGLARMMMEAAEASGQQRDSVVFFRLRVGGGKLGRRGLGAVSSRSRPQASAQRT